LGALIFFLLRKKSRGKSVTSSVSRGYRIVFIVLIPVLGLGIYGFYRKFGGFGQGRPAVLRETSLYRVPEYGTENSGGNLAPGGEGFAEGEAVLIRSVAGSWAYVESFDGRAGWVPADRLIPY
jgi:hypothetical protein